MNLHYTNGPELQGFKFLSSGNLKNSIQINKQTNSGTFRISLSRGRLSETIILYTHLALWMSLAMHGLLYTNMMGLD